MEDIRRRCNLMVDFSKFTSNKKIFDKFVLWFLMDLRGIVCRKNDWVTSRGPDLHGRERKRDRE